MKVIELRNLYYAFGCYGKVLEWWGCSQESVVVRRVSLVKIFEN